MSIVTPTSLLNNGSGTDGTLYTTASVSPPASELLLLFVSNGSVTTADVPTVGGSLGLTWTQIVTQENTSAAPGTLRGTWFRAVAPGSPPTGDITMTFATTQSNCQWHLVSVLGANTSAPVAQSISQAFNTTTNPSVNLATAPASTSVVLAAAVRNGTTAYTAGTDYTILSSVAGNSGPTCGSDVEYDLEDPIQAVRFTTASGAQKMLLGVEIAEASSGGAANANAGPNQLNIEPYSNIQLDGSGSSGTIASYSWSHISGPASNANLSSTTVANPTYETPGSIDGHTDVWRLTVTDNNSITDIDDVSITVFPVTERAVMGGVEVPIKLMDVSS